MRNSLVNISTNPTSLVSPLRPLGSGRAPSQIWLGAEGRMGAEGRLGLTPFSHA